MGVAKAFRVQVGQGNLENGALAAGNNGRCG